MLKDLIPGHEHFHPSLSRADRSARHAPRARRLNLSDVDWYAVQSRCVMSKDVDIDQCFP